VTQLFPDISEKDAEAAAAQYTGLGTNIFQVNGIMGECELGNCDTIVSVDANQNIAIFICPTYFLLRAFKGLAFKGEFAIPPGGHGQDVAYYFTK